MKEKKSGKLYINMRIYGLREILMDLRNVYHIWKFRGTYTMQIMDKIHRTQIYLRSIISFWI